jgi:hypothetical protein
MSGTGGAEKAQRGKRRRRDQQEEMEIAQAAVDASCRLLSTPAQALTQLEQAEVLGYQLVPAGSNYTFFALMQPRGSEAFLAVYKPREGETPLWDYPDGTLFKREHASYVTSVELGWPSIPPTVIRGGPHGIGMARLYVPPADEGFTTFRTTRFQELMEIALFDLLVNNGDRKAGHCIAGQDVRLWAIDHGLTFNRSTRLRTVLWDYCGEPIPDRLMSDLSSIEANPARQDRIRTMLSADLESADVDAFFARLGKILRSGRYPQLNPDRNLPWPLV